MSNNFLSLFDSFFYVYRKNDGAAVPSIVGLRFKVENLSGNLREPGTKCAIFGNWKRDLIANFSGTKLTREEWNEGAIFGKGNC